MKTKYCCIPYAVWSVIFVLVPLVIVAIFAFTASDGGFTIENVAKVADYTPVFVRSVLLSVYSSRCS